MFQIDDSKKNYSIWKKWGLETGPTHYNHPWKLKNVLDGLKSFYLCHRENRPFLREKSYSFSFFPYL